MFYIFYYISTDPEMDQPIDHNNDNMHIIPLFNYWFSFNKVKNDEVNCVIIIISGCML